MALVEYGCPSYEYVLEMSWAEFLIRQYAYNRVQKTRWMHTKAIEYASIVGSHLDPKTIPTKAKFMSVDEDSEEQQDLTEARMAAILAAKAQYHKDVAKNGRK